VDDDPQIRKLCRIALEASGHSVSEAGDGKQALQALEDAPADLILLDLCMPDMDGLEFLRAVGAGMPELKIITMSGFLGGAMLPAAKHLGGNATLAKPFSTDALLSLVDQVMSEGGKAGAFS